MSHATVSTAKLNNLTDILAANTAPTFAGGGIVITDMGGGFDSGRSVTVQADGNILLGGQGGGYYNNITDYDFTDFALARYNPDGSLDLSFDGDGKVTTNVGDDYGRSVTVQADGKILLVGTSGGDFALVRYNSDGSLDSSFGIDGKVITTGTFRYSATVQTDGKILLVGTSYNSSDDGDFALVRYNSDGSLDSSFGIDGKVTTDLGGNDSGTSVTVQTDGKILLSGVSDRVGNDDFALVRYNPDGSLDTSFSSDGKVTTDLGGDGKGSSVAVQADGKILLSGSMSGVRDWDFALVRYNANGSPDLSFSGDGKITTNISGYDYASSVTVQADGKILLGGTSNNSNSSGSDFVLVRYNSDGSLDLSFSDDGKVTTDSGDSEYGSSVTVQADGKILLGGTSNNDFALVRYNSDGSLDSSFNRINNTLNGKSSYIENSTAVVLDHTVQIYDAELAAQGHYNGASITLARQGGANAEDVFSGSGQLSFSGSDAILSGITIGTVNNSNGTLSLNFNSDATQARVDAVLSSIAYSNTTDYPPAPTDAPVSVQIDWTFNDGNTGTQGIGDALTATGLSIINILSNHPYEVVGTTGNDILGWDRGRGLADKIYGFAGNDNLGGRSGNDTLNGGEGNDTLNGGQGADSMLGGLGDDLYTVRGGDVVIENLNEGTDTINSNSDFYHLPDNVENLTLTGSNAIYGKGNDLANTLIGNDQDNRLIGDAGADTLTGGLGADIFKFNAEAETDTLVDFSHDQGDKINLAAIDANTALKGNNTFAAPTVGGAFSGSFANPGELYFDQTAHILYGNNDADSATDFSIMVMGVSSLVVADFVL